MSASFLINKIRTIFLFDGQFRPIVHIYIGTIFVGRVTLCTYVLMNVFTCILIAYILTNLTIASVIKTKQLVTLPDVDTLPLLLWNKKLFTRPSPTMNPYLFQRTWKYKANCRQIRQFFNLASAYFTFQRENFSLVDFPTIFRRRKTLPIYIMCVGGFLSVIIYHFRCKSHDNICGWMYTSPWESLAKRTTTSPHLWTIAILVLNKPLSDLWYCLQTRRALSGNPHGLIESNLILPPPIRFTLVHL